MTEIDWKLVLMVLGFIGGLITVWVKLNVNITKLEGRVYSSENEINGIKSLKKEQGQDIKEILSMLHRMEIKITKLETVHKLKDNDQD